MDNFTATEEAAKIENGGNMAIWDLAVEKRGGEWFVTLRPITSSAFGKQEAGPFATEQEALEVHKDLKAKALGLGGAEIPLTAFGETAQ